MNIVTEICSKGTLYNKFSGTLKDLDYIKINDKIIKSKEEIRQYINKGNVFGVVKYINYTSDMVLKIVIPSKEELKLYNYIEYSCTVLYKFSGVKSINVDKFPDSHFRFFIDDSIGSKYLSILNSLVQSDFDIIDGNFFIKFGKIDLIKYKLNCSESEFMRFITKLKVLKR